MILGNGTWFKFFHKITLFISIWNLHTASFSLYLKINFKNKIIPELKQEINKIAEKIQNHGNIYEFELKQISNDVLSIGELKSV